MPSFAARRSTGHVLHSISPSSAFTGRAETPSAAAAPIKRTCLCSPTNHPGSFRCVLHKGDGGKAKITSSNSSKLAPYNTGRLNSTARYNTGRLNSIGRAEGDLVKRVRVALIRPSSGRQKRRRNEEFQCRPSRLSVMSKA